MSTRSQLEFRESKNGEAVATIYHHMDGYPEGRLPDLMKMWSTAMSAYDKGGFGYRKTEPDIADLAAFYVVANKEGAGNVYLDNRLHGDIEFLYIVWSDGAELVVDIRQPKPAFWNEPTMSNTKSMWAGPLSEAVAKFC